MLNAACPRRFQPAVENPNRTPPPFLTSSVVRGGFGGGVSMFQSPMHIGFITMEPNSLFIPQYLDSHLTLFVRRGETRIGHIYKYDFAEKQLKEGDVYSIRPGSAFYLVNPAEGQRLHIICSISTSSSLGLHGFQSFFIGGGVYPTSILGGFDTLTLSTAFNLFGFAYLGPFGHFFHFLLDKLFKGKKDTTTVAKKILPLYPSALESIDVVDDGAVDPKEYEAMKHQVAQLTRTLNFSEARMLDMQAQINSL